MEKVNYVAPLLLTVLRANCHRRSAGISTYGIKYYE